jgi:predicted transcriptional regulator
MTYQGYVRAYSIIYFPQKEPEVEIIHIRRNTFKNILNFIKRAIKKDVVDTENVSTIESLMDSKMKQLLHSEFLRNVNTSRPIFKDISGMTVSIQIKQYIFEDDDKEE